MKILRDVLDQRALSGSLMTARSATTEKLLRHVEPVHPDADHDKIFARFLDDPQLRKLPMVENGIPVALIDRQKYLSCFVQPVRRELLGKQPCASTCLKFCEEARESCMDTLPLLVDQSTPIHELSGFLTESDGSNLDDGFVVTREGRYAGVGSAQDLLREITRMQIETARYANPLTQLPGNVPTNEHIEQLLETGEAFAVCYADIDHFKPFNDVYGYRKGDEAIQFTGILLNDICDPRYDFIGHIGGDDFILVMRSADWEQRCNRALASFARTSAVLFTPEHRSSGGYFTADRQGRVVRHPLPTLSLGVVWVDPAHFNSHYEVAEAASAARKMAKMKSGNNLFVERRGAALRETRFAANTCC